MKNENNENVKEKEKMDNEKVLTRAKRIELFGENPDNVVIPDEFTVIGQDCFEHCYELKSVLIPNSITKIKYGAFSGCDSLKYVTIPDSVIEIGKYVFYDCDSELTVELPSHLKEYSDIINVDVDDLIWREPLTDHNTLSNKINYYQSDSLQSTMNKLLEKIVSEINENMETMSYDERYKKLIELEKAMKIVMNNR